MCGNIIDQILQKSLEGVAALSVSSGGMLYRHIDNTVRGQHQKIADLRQDMYSSLPSHLQGSDGSDGNW